MATFHFDLVSPEELLISGEVEQVDIPGAEGDFGVLAGHAPLVTTLRPGIMTIKRNGSEEKVVIFGGFAEVSPTGLTVLADVATAVEDFDKAVLAAQIKKSEEKVKKLENSDGGSALDREISRLDHFKWLDFHLTGTAMH
ncbi:F0F1 ATP synthase subunit epsilon [Pseudorhodoplanes sinuspersici]|uniref:ATP synthase epsilon chain n=1 Tax=Pseudorhodoplanes sinuspersici TaxID=1235591 RepID=A0A1W6ZQ66_9HYPH|nr:F0F1 ATP synthase subunit epsilon [Pseudorhodoplanes sinuspersici]ARP98914.1 F0F1 ATP synthase subunit epsilon [Pseudorhodoplanes sinuspersici]RKE69457.1 ATP synthase F1 subcomplex epsilon subunit [Pseudorhodoplanes sinuspersici]